MNSTITRFAPVVGRCMIALIFLLAGFQKITGFTGTAAGMASKGLPMAELLLVITIVIEFGGALMLILGWHARLAAAALFLWIIPVSLVYHNFWAMEGMAQTINQIMFLKNISIMGAMLYIMAFGTGRYSLDKK